MSWLNKILVVVITTGLILVTILGCAAPSEPAAQAELKGPIKICSLTDLTGPAAATLAPVHYGIMDYFEWLNQEKKGVDGHPVEVKWVDTKYDIPTGLSSYERMKDEGVICFTGMMTGTLMALSDRLTKDGIPWILSLRNVSAFMYPVKPFFGLYGTDSDCTVKFLEWFWEAKLDRAHPIKMAAVYLDTPYGRAALAGGVSDWIQAHPEIVDFPNNLSLPVAPSVTDLTPECIKIKAANVDLIAHQLLKPQFVPFFDSLTKLNMTDPVFFMGGGAGGTMLEAVQKAPPGGHYSMEGHPYPYETDNPVNKQILARRDKIEPSYEIEWNYMGNWITGEVMREGVAQALKTVGYDNLDAAAVYSALEATQGFEPYKGFPKINYSTSDHRGVTMSRTYFTS